MYSMWQNLCAFWNIESTPKIFYTYCLIFLYRFHTAALRKILFKYILSAKAFHSTGKICKLDQCNETKDKYPYWSVTSTYIHYTTYSLSNTVQIYCASNKNKTQKTKQYTQIPNEVIFPVSTNICFLLSYFWFPFCVVRLRVSFASLSCRSRK